MAWRAARSITKIRQQTDAAFPRRSKASDGIIGDTAHSNRNSDHNPWYGPGVVTAIDITHDPGKGVDCDRLYAALVRHKDARIKYIIWDRTITSSKSSPWVRRKYTGSNPHTKHLHLSVVPSSRADRPDAWNLAGCVGVKQRVVAKVTNGTYRVVQGDTLGMIAKRAGITLASLRAMNPGVKGDTIHPGQQLTVSRPAPPPVSAAQAVVRPRAKPVDRWADPPRRPAGPAPLVERGDKGPWVEFLQWLLRSYYKGARDGVFGPKLQAAVEAFQRRWWRGDRSKWDGWVDTLTWHALGVR